MGISQWFSDRWHGTKNAAKAGYSNVRHTAAGDFLTGTEYGADAAKSRTASSLGQLGHEVNEASKATLKGPSTGPIAKGLDRGAAAPIRGVTKFFKHNRLAGAALLILGGGALAAKLAGQKSTPNTGNIAVEDEGRQLAQAEFIRGSQRATMDVDNAIQQQMMATAPNPMMTIGGGPSNLAMADTAMYQGRMEQPVLEQSIS